MLNFFCICEYLGVAPAEFFDYTHETPKRDADLYNEIRRLDKRSKEYVFSVVRAINNRPE
jgi:hypothetical protein